MPSGSQSARVLNACSTFMPRRSTTGPNRLRRSAISLIPGMAVSIIHSRSQVPAAASASCITGTQRGPQAPATKGRVRPVVESVMGSADHCFDARLGVVDGPKAAAGRGQAVGEVADAFGQDAQYGNVRLQPALGVVRVELLVDGHASHGCVAVAELGQPPVRKKAVE